MRYLIIIIYSASPISNELVGQVEIFIDVHDSRHIRLYLSQLGKPALCTTYIS